ncbi:nucleotidyltransferase domain-containing protein [Kribbella sp. CA-293567]|uniref:nucleotidyltransferase domain-containing protein n=1 Tax=Kribbella sp. CA-293567 TaxID=3002436 RepID=UPI0022DE2A03|nr:nucleotidyltransferase domain-containing protein [Kribbella sp. CA-293567]WBQ08341.1 nucleotidyltransferase domain-containing protein [Kribbella sp. CA-293567]
MLTEREIRDLVDRIVARADPEEVIVIGSYAKGTATAASDLDLVLIRDTDLPVSRRATDVTPLVSSSLIPVDIHVFTREEVDEYAKEPYSFLYTVTTTGRSLYRRESHPSITKPAAEV